MRQLSLLEESTKLAGLMPALRACMRRVAGEPEGEGRKALVESMNTIANQAEIRLTGGNAKSISKDTLDKVLSPSDGNHTPGILMLAVFCKASNNYEPLRVLLHALGLEIMTAEDKQDLEYGRAVREEKEAQAKRKRLEAIRREV